MLKLKTPEQAKQAIKDQGLTISKFAIDNGLPASVVYALLKGQIKGSYGEAHRAAVLLGIKAESKPVEKELKRA
ncbi:phage-associated protein, BcepMu gp16 family [Nitrosomonas aestuarii]|uniref:Phage-associated protein, BcepMu gp16 family n=1 Tax=Nitrosomonas aestuarii TaxID=52441 RepID=A0A1I4DHP4_9PROT|nr:DNA-binding protein [Nitrosomonas aestuarii]SFK93118.1 phage-associated protein, BcepMu gp16 family [Nitrosomonas aestuarii]